MDSNLVIALIGAGGTIVGAAIGAMLGRSDIIDSLFPISKNLKLGKKLESLWEETIDGSNIIYREIIEITRQKGTKVYGKITMESEPDKEWQLEGNYNGRFLQLIWCPSKNSDDKYFKDYGCYFFEELSDGSFDGYAVGHDWASNKVEIGKHKLKRIR